MIADTPVPPYYAVIFTSVKSPENEGYPEMAKKMFEMAAQQPGYLGYESAGEAFGITVSYWENQEAIRNWKQNSDHLFAQEQGKKSWYEQYSVRVCLVEKAYGFSSW